MNLISLMTLFVIISPSTLSFILFDPAFTNSTSLQHITITLYLSQLNMNHKPTNKHASMIFAFNPCLMNFTPYKIITLGLSLLYHLNKESLDENVSTKLRDMLMVPLRDTKYDCCKRLQSN